MADEPRNIVLILSDEQHRTTVGCYGGSPVRTPHADRLAAEGMRFDQAFCCVSVCSPSRAAVFTGLWPHRFGTIVNDLTIPAGTPNLAGLLRQQGYRLGYAGKWHVDRASVPSTHGFDGNDHPGYGFPTWMLREGVEPVQMQRKRNPYYEYLVERGLPVPRLEEPHEAPGFQGEGIRIIDARQTGPVESSIPYYVGDEATRITERLCRKRKNDGAPFFLWANFWGPHNPCYIPEPYYSMYDPRSIEEPPSARDMLEGKPSVQRTMANYWGMYGAPWEEWQQHIARYLGYCTLIDDQVGRVYQALAESGELERTLFVYSTDHGDMLGRHQLMDKGPCMYDDTYRIPLVVRGPGVRQGTCDEFVYLHDLFATILETAGVETPPRSDSASLCPLFTGAGGWQARDAVFGEAEMQVVHFPQRMVRTRTHKFIYNPAAECELYDLVKDPHEMHNAVNDPAYAGVKEELKARLAAHLEATNDREFHKFALLAKTF